MLYEDQGISARVRGTIQGFGEVLATPLDVDQNGVDEILATGDDNIYLFDTDLRGMVDPSVADWTLDYSDLDPAHPFRENHLVGPGSWFGLDASAFVGWTGEENVAVDLGTASMAQQPVEIVPGFCFYPWRWDAGDTTVVMARTGTEYRLEGVGGELDGRTWNTVDNWGLQNPLGHGFADSNGTAHLVFSDVGARRILAKPLDDADSPLYTLLGTVHTRDGDLTFGGGPMAIGRFDADDVDDLAIGSGPHAVAVWLGPLQGTLTDRPPDLVFSVPNDEESPVNSFIEAADLDGDGVDELAVSASGYGPGTVYIFRDLFAPHED